ncbi:MAG: hypothetical protein OHK0044_26820 [Burkholderiaceae bacterium]
MRLAGKRAPDADTGCARTFGSACCVTAVLALCCHAGSDHDSRRSGEGAGRDCNARGARQGKSMQAFVRAALERLAARPSIDAWLNAVRKRKRAARTLIPAREILRYRDADRR